MLRALRAELPHEHFVYFADTAHAPYGERDESHVVERTLHVVQELLRKDRIKALVVACNTATAAAIRHVREAHPRLPVVGVEPALKPAVMASRTRRIGVLATRGTLASAKFRALHDSLFGQASFILQPCDGLAEAIESGDDTRTAQLCEAYMQPLGPLGARDGDTDTVVLGCTHYPFVRERLQAIAGPSVAIIETGEAVARRTRSLLAEWKLLVMDGTPGLRLRSSGPRDALEAAARRWSGFL